MGMGEPLHNYDDTMKALRMLTDEHGLAMTPRRVTLSTVGVVPAIERLATRADDAEPGDFAARTTEEQRNDCADQPQVPARRIARRLPALPVKRREPHHLRYVLLTGSTTRPKTRAGWSGCCHGIKAR